MTSHPLIEICNELLNAIDSIPYEYGSMSAEEVADLDSLVGRAREAVNKASADTDTSDAMRYRWIKAQRNLELITCRMYGVPWTNTETGKQFYPSHYLSANGTGFGGIEKLDDLIDQAMELYPTKEQ